MEIDRGEFSVKLDWVQTEPAKDVSFAVRIPTSTENIKIEPDPPGSPQENLLGEKLFTLAPVKLVPGEATVISVAYSRPELAGGTKDFPLIPVLGGALAVAIVVLLIAIVRQGQRTAGDIDD